MIDLQEDYRNYLLAVKKVLHEYNKTKERLDELEAAWDNEKKKFIEGAELSVVNQESFPSGVKVYSTDDERNNESFVLLNRELEYLKQASLRYIKDQNLEFLLKHINFDCWREYHDKLVESKQPPKKKTKRVKRRRKRNVSTLNRMAQLTAQQKDVKRDIVFSWPIDRSSFWLSSFFGPRRKTNGVWGFHAGLDMAAVRGTPVLAAAAGVVLEAYHHRGYGKTVLIAHNRKYRTRYAHLSSLNVKVGQKVERGYCVGKVGATGHVRARRGRSGDHLHFEVCSFGKHVNPLYYLV